MKRANRNARQWAYHTCLIRSPVRLALVASIYLAPSVMREARFTLPTSGSAGIDHMPFDPFHPRANAFLARTETRVPQGD